MIGYDALALLLVVFLVILLLFAIIGGLVYYGISQNVEFGAGRPPIEAVNVAYKYIYVNPDGDASLSTAVDATKKEVRRIAPAFRLFLAYYDHDEVSLTHGGRLVIGAILSEGKQSPDKDILENFKRHGYKETAFPAIVHAVITTIPRNTGFSAIMGIRIKNVYCQMLHYIKEHKLCAHPFIEIHEASQIHFMAPLSKQNEFGVPEMNHREERSDSLHHRQHGTPHDGPERVPKDLQPTATACHGVEATFDIKETPDNLSTSSSTESFEKITREEISNTEA